MKGTDVSQPVEIIGLIDVHSEMKDQDRALEALKAKAGALGADAVLDVEYHHAVGGEPSHLSGMAVRCNDLVRGRAYETIGSVQSDGAMGSEERAFKNMLAKARAMHADLVIGVRFEHGEGGEGEGTKVTGTAIKFRSGS